ncbi:MAG: hypothetical protein AAF844_16230, partial [Pseudomonadota bacterium]
MMAAPVPARAEAQSVDGEVPFLTLRNKTEADDPSDLFGTERGGLSAGHCRARRYELQALSRLVNAVPAFLREEFLRVEEVDISDAASL